MQKLLTGIHNFQSQVFKEHEELFCQLSLGQIPEALFITCSDSRIIPNMITQTDPGDLFTLRNAGNIIPAYGELAGGEIATIEYAVAVLGVKDIVICGHTLCGAMMGLLHPEQVKDLPAVGRWLKHAERTKQIVEEIYAQAELTEDQRWVIAVEENVLVQLEHLKSYPVVAQRMAEDKLKLHGWVYKIQTGQVFGYDQQSGQFLPLVEAASQAGLV